MNIPKRLLDKIEFYITNVCNLDCEDCNRFNNYHFKGYQKWADYQHEYSEWGKYLEFKHITLLGGEPLLNPTLPEWIVGLNNIFTTPVQVLSNGTRLAETPGLYDLIFKNRAWIGVSIHNVDEIEMIFDQVERFLGGVVLKEVGPNSNKFGADYCFWGKGHKPVPMWLQHEFMPSSIFTNERGRLTLHNNNPELAHRDCAFVQSKNYHFIDGKLYKCGPVALFPDFDKQHDLDITPEDKILINSYKPLEVGNFETDGERFFAELDNVIPQCKFCPVAPKFKQIFPISKNLRRKM